jgi:hypothetical protein
VNNIFHWNRLAASQRKLGAADFNHGVSGGFSGNSRKRCIPNIETGDRRQPEALDTSYALNHVRPGRQDMGVTRVDVVESSHIAHPDCL